MKPITTEALNRRTDRHNSSVAFANGGTLKNKTYFLAFYNEEVIFRITINTYSRTRFRKF